MNDKHRLLRSQAIGIQAKVRRALLATPTLTRTLQSCRAVIHFGPWRHAARALIRIARPPLEGGHKANATVLELDTSRLVDVLRTDGTAMAGVLPPDILRRLREVTDVLPPGEYGDFHEVPDVRAMVHSAAVLNVARRYLGAEPVLLECNLLVAHAENPAVRPKRGSQRQFHFDYGGWDSLNLFIYLTDVSEDSGAHQVVVGTHRAHTGWDAVRVSIADDEISNRFPDRIRTITGPAGTMFFEDTSAFHRRKAHSRRRVMLNILWASHRSWLSKGRLVPKYSDFVRSYGGKREVSEH